MRFKERKSRLEKARSKFEKNSRHKKQLQFHFVREKNKHGNFKTKIYLKRGVREQYSGKGILHKAVNSRFRIKGERPSFTRAINSAEMQSTDWTKLNTRTSSKPVSNQIKRNTMQIFKRKNPISKLRNRSTKEVQNQRQTKKFSKAKSRNFDRKNVKFVLKRRK